MKDNNDFRLEGNFSGFTNRRYPEWENHQQTVNDCSSSTYKRKLTNPSRTDYQAQSFQRLNVSGYHHSVDTNFGSKKFQIEDDIPPPPPPKWPDESESVLQLSEEVEDGNDEDDKNSAREGEQKDKETDQPKYSYKSMDARRYNIVDTSSVMGRMLGDRQSIFEKAWNNTVRFALRSSQQVRNSEELFTEKQFVKEQLRVVIASEDLIPFVYRIVKQLPPLWPDCRFRLIRQSLRRATIVFPKKWDTKYKSCGEILDIFARENRNLCVDKWIIYYRRPTDMGVEFFILGIDQETVGVFKKIAQLNYHKRKVKMTICGKTNKIKGPTRREERIGRRY